MVVVRVAVEKAAAVAVARAAAAAVAGTLQKMNRTLESAALSAALAAPRDAAINLR